MQGNENNDTNMSMKRANKHNRLSCLISTSISFHSMCLVIIKIADMWFISLLTVWFGLLQVCYKFVASLLQSLNTQTQINAPPNRNHTILDLVLLVG